jgi:hypothetical protein
MSKQQLLLKHELTVSQILRTYGKQFRQIRLRYSDGTNGRCAMGVIMSYYGWDGREDFDAVNNLLDASDKLNHADIDYSLLKDLNDSGFTFKEIANYLDRTDGFNHT